MSLYSDPETEWAAGLDAAAVGREYADSFLANVPVSLTKGGIARIEREIIAAVLELEFDDVVVLAKDLGMFDEWLDKRAPVPVEERYAAYLPEGADRD